MDEKPNREVRDLAIDLDRDFFLRRLLRELAGTLEDVVGVEEASGYISVVGRAIGAGLDREYRLALDTEKLELDQVVQVLIDLKRRINGDFFLIEQSSERVIFGNRRCPFAESVIGRPSMCMMTSNVFGSIAAENLGYARVDLEETIAAGDPGCRIVLHLEPGDPKEPVSGQEYFRDPVDLCSPKNSNGSSH